MSQCRWDTGAKPWQASRFGWDLQAGARAAHTPPWNMPSITRSPSGQAAVGELVTLNDEGSGARVVIAPERGALVTSFSVSGKELLYLDPATLNDAGKNVRGGIPILFPAPGKLEGDAWRALGRAGEMKQHGFGRNVAWSVQSGTRPGDSGSGPSSPDVAAVTLSLDATPLTLAQYPWAFHVELAFTLEGFCLRLVARVRNDSATEMPFALGYHPYFLAADKRQVRIDTHATRAFDNVTKRTALFGGFDLELPEVDLHLLDHGSSASALHFADGSQITLTGSPEFTHWVVWTLAGKDFVCLEPWTAPGNALNTGERLFTLRPAEQRECSLELAWSPGTR
jgi:galactose mutarotase-like enzyme